MGLRLKTSTGSVYTETTMISNEANMVRPVKEKLHLAAKQQYTSGGNDWRSGRSKTGNSDVGVGVC